MNIFAVNFFTVLFSAIVHAIPPLKCNQKFNYNDCGLTPPKRVFYYYRQGSRCEIAQWKGCRPNLNMFANERDCIKACVFDPRPSSGKYHKIDEVMFEINNGPQFDHMEDALVDKEPANVIESSNTGSDTAIEPENIVPANGDVSKTEGETTIQPDNIVTSNGNEWTTGMESTTDPQINVVQG